MKNISAHKFVLVIMGTDDNGEEEAFVSAGRAVYNEADNTVSIFKEGVSKPVFILQEDEFDQIEKVNEEMKSVLLDADYMMVLNIKPLPSDVDPAEGRKLPFKYPGHETDSQ